MKKAAKEAPRLKVSPEAVARARAAGKRKVPTPWAVAEPMPGVVPAGVKPEMASDWGGLYGQAGAYGLGSIGGAGVQWLGYPLLSELAQIPEYRKISETIAREMTRQWIKITAKGEEDKSATIATIEAALRRFKVQELFRRVAELDGFFGRGHIYLDTGATDNEAELQIPLVVDPRKIRKGGLQALKIVEPVWTYPTGYDATNPLGKDFYRPQSWYVMGKKVHRSRLLTFVGRELPDLLKPAYAFSGVSLSQMALAYVDNWLRTRQSVSDLLHSFSVSGLKTNMAATLAGAGGEDMLHRVGLFNGYRDNGGMMMLDKDTEDFFNVSTPLGTLDALQAQAQEQLASVSGIPLVKLLGITPSGLNASADGEVRVFYDTIAAYQEHLFRPHLSTIIDIIQLSELGEIDPEIEVHFNPLWEQNEKERAEIMEIQARTDIAYTEASIMAPDDIRATLAADGEGRYSAVDLSGPPPEPEPTDEDLGDPFGAGLGNPEPLVKEREGAE